MEYFFIAYAFITFGVAFALIRNMSANDIIASFILGAFWPSLIVTKLFVKFFK